MCLTGKIQYKTKIDAEYALYQIKRKYLNDISRKEQRVYFCPLCKSFHLTSQTKNKIITWKNLNN